MIEWIKCSDRLPECAYGYFLVCRVYHAQGSAPHVMPSFYIKDREQAREQLPYFSRKTQGKYSVHFQAAEPGFIITHWMPLPEPPTE
nr:MAG TPA: Protein of unknown function (DUF551) [Caudoviricetes sp.]